MPPFDARFNYRAEVVNLNLLEKSTSRDIAHITHRCAGFSKYPQASHGDALVHLVNYLKAMRTQGITLDSGGNKSFEVYTDTDL